MSLCRLGSLPHPMLKGKQAHTSHTTTVSTFAIILSLPNATLTMQSNLRAARPHVVPCASIHKLVSHHISSHDIYACVITSCCRGASCAHIHTLTHTLSHTHSDHHHCRLLSTNPMQMRAKGKPAAAAAHDPRSHTTNPIVTGTSVLAIRCVDGVSPCPAIALMLLSATDARKHQYHFVSVRLSYPHPLALSWQHGATFLVVLTCRIGVRAGDHGCRHARIVRIARTIQRRGAYLCGGGQHARWSVRRHQ